MLAHHLEAPIREEHGSFAGPSSMLTQMPADRQVVIGYRNGEPRAEVVS